MDINSVQMEKNNIENVVESLKCGKNKQHIYSNLTKLVSILKEQGQYKSVLKFGGIRHVVHYLTQKNMNIVDVSLSLLANCCLERDCATEVVRCNGIKTILSILATVKKDSILCRACRLVGNISRYDNYAAAFCNFGAVRIIVDILNSSTSKNSDLENNEKVSMDTQAMAIRALRTFWKHSSQRSNMMKDGAVRAVSAVLTQHTEIWLNLEPEKRIRKQSFLRTVLECLLLFSRHKSKECVEQISADGFQALVSLMTLYPYNCAKCLTNLSTVATSRAEIANAAAVKCIINMINQYLNKNPDSPYPNDLIETFTLFCKHPINCMELKYAGGIELVLKLLKNCKSRRHEYILVRTLNIFRSDRAAMDILVANDFVNVFIDRLDSHFGEVDLFDNDHVYMSRQAEQRLKRRRLRRSSESSDECERSDSGVSNSSSQRNHNGSGYSPQYDSSTSSQSPRSLRSSPSIYYVASESEASPLSSPSCTPPRESEMDDDDDSENYSPVCSDAEEEQRKDAAVIPNTSTNPDPDTSMDKSDTESSDESWNKSNITDRILKERSKNIMSSILMHSMGRDVPPPTLSTMRAVQVLLKYIKLSTAYENSIILLVSRILVTPCFRPNVIKSGIMMAVYKVSQHPHDLDCTQCKQLHDRVRQFTHCLLLTKQLPGDAINCLELLQKLNGDEKKIGILSCTILIMPNIVFFKVLQRTSSLDILVRLFGEMNYYRKHISEILHRMFMHLNVSNPSKVCMHGSPKSLKISEDYEPGRNAKNLVGIKFDDGVVVPVDKDFLISQSDYFRTMLTGSFRERTADEIPFKNVPRKAFCALLNILKKNCPRFGPAKLCNNINTVLDLVVLSDIYLLDSLLSWLTLCVELFLIKKDNASQIYNWSIVSRTGYFRLEVIAFVMTERMDQRERAKILESICDYGHMDALTEDIVTLMERFGAKHTMTC